ncbi:ABC transporter substrate-binding protein [Tropicimonas sp.]|uniref:ABC transporter substrate-binding protein n=1 Tax=Tropicimonas sp. TaxID=2067044 RepID=UPI003A89D979
MQDFGKGWSRRSFLRSGVALGAGMFAAPSLAQSLAFGAASGELPPADGPVRWLDSGDTKGVFLKRALAEYGQARGVDVVYDGLPWNEIATVLPLGIRNGSAPDTFCLPNGMEPSVALAEGWIQPIEEHIPDFETWRQAFPDGAFVEGINVFGGKTYGFPFSSERRFNNALLFDRKMMDEAGYGHIGADRALTFDEMRDAARKITENAGGRAFGFIIGGNQLGRWGNTATMLAQRGGATVGSNGLLEGMDMMTGEFVYGGDEYVAGVELLLALRDDGSVFPGVLTINAPQAREFITQGAAGMIVQGPWNIPIWEANAPHFDFGVSPGPAPDESGLGNSVWVLQLPNTGNMMWLNAAARNAAYVGDFFHWLGSLDGQVAYANVASCADPAIFPETVKLVDLSARAVAMLEMAGKYVRIAPNPFVRNPDLAAVAAAYVDPTPNLAQAVQGLFAGQLSDVRGTLGKVADARNKALDDAIAKARAGGANVSRDDFAFQGVWTPAADFGPADYAKL